MFDKMLPKDKLTCVAFAPARQHGLVMLAAGSMDGQVRFYELQRNMSPSFLRITMEDDDAQTSKPAAGSAPAPRPGITALAFNPSIIETKLVLAVGSYSGNLAIFVGRGMKFIRVKFVDDVVVKVDCPVNSIAWAPAVGRLFHLIAIASKQMTLILRVTPLHGRTSFSGDESDTEIMYCCQVYEVPQPSTAVAWDHSATLLLITNDDQITVLQLTDAGDHDSWEIIAQR
jgi:WD40 repeat protein